MTVSSTIRRHWRTALCTVVGAVLGAIYAHFVGCRTGTCAITSNVWTAALFFGFTGAIVGLPGPRSVRKREDGGGAGPART
jgi:hypothetical protein